MNKDNLATLPDNILDFKAKNVNLNIDGDIISLSDLEKIFFLSKLNSDPAFISSITKIESTKIDRLVHSLKFEEVCNEYFTEFALGNAGESIEQLSLRYMQFLKECFLSVRTTVGLRIRDALQNDKVLDAKWLNIPLIEKLMRLEFALHGMPIDLRGVVVKHNKDTSKDKSDKELMDSVKEIQETLESISGKTFSPNSFLNSPIDAEFKDVPLEESDEETNE